MKVLVLQQGSPEWLAHRATARNASEAPVIMGSSRYMTRQELIQQKATGYTPETDPAKQRIFDRGHEAEAAARELLEAATGEDFFPVVATSDDGYLSASMDGINMAGDTLFEHKLWNNDMSVAVQAGELPPMYYWQLEQQLLVSGAEKVIFVCSNGTPDCWAQMEYRPVPGRAEQLVAAWKQFDADVAEYVPPDVIPAVVGEQIEGFGALVLRVEGRVVACNLDTFRAGAADFLARLPKAADLATDQDFATAEIAVKACADAESRIKAAKDAGLSQMADVDAVLRAADQVIAEIKAARIALEKSVSARKDAIRQDMIADGKKRLDAYVVALNKQIGRAILPPIPADFAGAIKSKRTIDSLRNAIEVTLANAKALASGTADKIEKNLSLLDAQKEHAALFPDVATLVMKSGEDLQNVITVRIANHQAEQQKQQAEINAALAKAVAQQEQPQVEQPALAAVEQKPIALNPATASADTPDYADRILELISGMDNNELKIVVHCCERIVSQRMGAAA